VAVIIGDKPDRRLLHSLRDTYARHIKEEETQVFPKAARLLTTSDLQAVGSEMAKRRGLPFAATQTTKKYNAVLFYDMQ
jgi:hemerythrin-like domain-containing protein